MIFTLTKSLIFPGLKTYTRVAFYCTSNRGRKRRTAFYQPNVGVRHQLEKLKETDPEAGIKNLEVDEDLNEYDDVITKSHRLYDKHQQEKEYQRKKMLFNIIRRKYFKEQPEPCFLTMAAKEQLRFLREDDPETWTFQKLAESFPITVTGVKKLLKSKHYVPRSEEDLIKHDKKVLENWKMLKAGKGGPIATVLSERLLSGKFNFQAMNGDSTLPMPTNEWRQKYLPSSKNAALETEVGEFELMVKECRNLDQSRYDGKSLENKTEFLDEKQESLQQMATLSSKLSNRKGSLHATFEQFKASLKKELKKTNEAGDLNKLKDWFKNVDPKPKRKIEKLDIYKSDDDPYKILDVFEGKLQVFKDSNVPDIRWDNPREAKSPNDKEAYIYSPDTGYQRPYGRFENTDKIVIPPNKRKSGGVYKKGDCVYDEDGNFIYKIPY